MAELVISTLTPADAGEVLTLQRAAYVSEARLYGDVDLPPLTETHDELRAELATGLGLKATDGGRIVGAVRGRVDGAVLHIGRLIVAPDRQGEGIGSALLGAIERRAAGTVERYTLFTGHLSRANLRLYQRLGYTEARREELSPGLVLVHLDKRRTEGRTEGRAEVTFRAAVRADLPAVVALIADDVLGRVRDGAVVDDAYEKAFADIEADPRNVLAVADEAGSVVACLQVTYIPGLGRHGAERALVESVRVRSDRRGQGLGERFLTWVIDQARARGCALVQLTTDKSRRDAHRFYARLGFVASHEGMKLHLR